MKRQLLRSNAFVRAARRALKKSPLSAEALGSALQMLEQDAFQPGLRSHKLKGRLEGTWACSAGFDLRILFRFVDHQKTEAILLLTVGNHEEIY